MATKHSIRLAWAALPIAAIAVAVPSPTLADPLPYGPDTCIQGYVWRDARPGDNVCVTPQVRDRTAQENANPTQNREPNGGPYGPDTCKQGFVWRDAFDGDHICVTPEIRAQTSADNAAAESRKQANPQPAPAPAPAPDPDAYTVTVTFEVFGSGTAQEIDSYIDDLQDRKYSVVNNVPLPWSRTVPVTIASGINDILPRVVAFTAKPAGCRISIDGRVMTEQEVGGTPAMSGQGIGAACQYLDDLDFF
jgi:MmpS family membrane protein